MYPKFRKKEDCAYPERIECNYDTSGKNKYERCEYMYYDNNESPFSPYRWKCSYKKP